MAAARREGARPSTSVRAASSGHVSRAKGDAGGTDPASAPRRFTRAKLAAYNGKTPGRLMLIAYKGKVYDVNRSYPWAGGVHWARVQCSALQTSGIDNTMFTNSSSKPRVRHERAT